MPAHLTGEIRTFDYLPQDWAFCNGQSIQVAQNQTLYTVIGNLYGGNSTAFNLPNLQGWTVIGSGAGPRNVPVAAARTVRL